MTSDEPTSELVRLNPSLSRATRRIVFVAAPGTEVLDLVGPLQVFARASEIFVRQNPGASPIYSVEVVTTSSHRSFVTNCGLRITAHRTFRELRGNIDTLLVAGGSAIENDEVNAEVDPLVENHCRTNSADRFRVYRRHVAGARRSA